MIDKSCNPHDSHHAILATITMNVFIHNPIAGNFNVKKREALLDLIKSDPENIVLETKNKNDETLLTKKAIDLGAKKVIAIGGDGTINKVASILSRTNISMGLIPMGSGNGLARHLGISLDPRLALKNALSGNPIQIDACLIENKVFFCTAGIGFDAMVADIFDKRKKRGLLNYIIAIFIALKKYKPIEIEIEPGRKEKIFLLTIANANQYGNNAIIAPYADIQDGKFELVKIKTKNPFSLLLIGFRLFLKNIHKSSGVEIISADSISFKYKVNQPLHIDGESIVTENENIQISIDPKALTVVL